MWIFEWVFGWFGTSGRPPRVGIHILVEPNELDLIPQIEHLNFVEQTEDNKFDLILQIEQLDFIEQTEDIDMMVH